MTSLIWGSPLPNGSVVHVDIINNLHSLKNLILDLNESHLKLISFNDTGIIVDHKDNVSIKEKIYEIETRLRILNNQITLKDNNNITHYEEVTDSFYILFKHLPEEIKQKLKIYIKS